MKKHLLIGTFILIFISSKWAFTGTHIHEVCLDDKTAVSMNISDSTYSKAKQLFSHTQNQLDAEDISSSVRLAPSDSVAIYDIGAEGRLENERVLKQGSFEIIEVGDLVNNGEFQIKSESSTLNISLSLNFSYVPHYDESRLQGYFRQTTFINRSTELTTKRKFGYFYCLPGTDVSDFDESVKSEGWLRQSIRDIIRDNYRIILTP